MKKMLLLMFLFAMANTFAQTIDDYIELLKSDIKTQKVEIINGVMEFSEEESNVFWPLYREFAHELDKLSDKRVANIKEFAANYDTLTNDQADKLISNSFDFLEERLELNRDFYKTLSKALSPTIAAKYAQLEHEIQLILDLNISANMPLVKKAVQKGK